MKLQELQSSSIHEELSKVWETQDQLDEGIWDSMKTGFSQIANTIAQVRKNADSKGELNDRILRQMYLEELEKFKGAFEKAPEKVKAVIEGLLAKAGIKMSGIDISRKNLHRIMVLKILRLVLFAIAQMRDNGIQWLLSSVVTSGLSAIISLLMNAKDYKDIGDEMVNIGRQLKTLLDKTKQNTDNNP